MSRVRDIIQRGSRAVQPDASSVSIGTIYYVTDESVTERSTGSAWEDISDGGSGVSDHGALTGLDDDDHSAVYPLITNFESDRATLATNWDDLTDGGETSLHTHAGIAASNTDQALEEGQLNTAFYDVPGVGEGHIFVTIDGGGSAITTGVKGDLYLPFPIKLKWVAILADQSSSSIVIDVWHVAGLGAIPTDSNSITASDPPTLTNGVDSIDTNIVTWTVDLDPGRMRFNVDSNTTTTRANMILGYQRRDVP